MSNLYKAGSNATSTPVKISKDVGNQLTTGADDGLMVPAAVPEKISVDAGNELKRGKDGGLFSPVAPVPLKLSTDDGNAATLGADGGIFVSRAAGVTYRPYSINGTVLSRKLRRASPSWSPVGDGSMFAREANGVDGELRGGGIILLPGRYQVRIEVEFGLRIHGEGTAYADVPAVVGDQMSVLLVGWDSRGRLVELPSPASSVLLKPGMARQDVVVAYAVDVIVSQMSESLAVSPLMYFDSTSAAMGAAIDPLFERVTYNINSLGAITRVIGGQMTMTVTRL